MDSAGRCIQIFIMRRHNSSEDVINKKPSNMQGSSSWSTMDFNQIVLWWFYRLPVGNLTYHRHLSKWASPNPIPKSREWLLSQNSEGWLWSLTKGSINSPPRPNSPPVSRKPTGQSCAKYKIGIKMIWSSNSLGSFLNKLGKSWKFLQDQKKLAK